MNFIFFVLHTFILYISHSYIYTFHVSRFSFRSPLFMDHIACDPIDLVQSLNMGSSRAQPITDLESAGAKYSSWVIADPLDIPHGALLIS